MNRYLCTLLLAVLPTLTHFAAAETPAPPAMAAPAPVTYEVWGFRWDGRQWVRQADHSFATTDVRQALDYVRMVNSYPGWCATTNCPGAAPRGTFHARVNLPGIVISGPWEAYINRAIAQAQSQAQARGGEVDEDNTPSYDSTFTAADNGDSDRLQAQFNQQQDMINMQNMQNTQDMINTQNMVNTQMMNDQMNAAATQQMIQSMNQ